MNNASAQAIHKAQRAFAGIAEDIGVYDEDDVQNLVNEVWYGKGQINNADFSGYQYFGFGKTAKTSYATAG